MRLIFLTFIACLACGAPPQSLGDRAVVRARMRLNTIEFQIRAHPARPAEAILLARETAQAYRDGLVGPGKIDGAARFKRAEHALVAAIAAQPTARSVLLSVKGRLLEARGETDAALATFEKAMQAGPSVETLESMLKLAEPPIAVVKSLCKKTLAATTLEADRFEVLRLCLLRSRARSIKGGLDWATGGDRIFYRRESARRGLATDAALAR